LSLISRIDTPSDLKVLSRKELTQLAAEIRSIIVEVVSKSGGHLASSLGAVELAIALHYVFDLPGDRLIWDVGHQAYAHKLLTGRRDKFHTLRQHGGISGFTKRSESSFDAFSTGHSSTSISAGLGMACAKRLRNENKKIITVIGDGSMTAGMAYEGLNQAGDIHKDLIVVLNDNDMSIAPNVGALSSLLSRTFSDKRLQENRKKFGDFLKSLPRIGDDIYQWAKRTEESFKSFVTPGMLFEAFNFEYFGPINGHNLDHLINILQNIKELNEPVLLHVTTTKGKGYAPAERNPIYYHGVGCFEVETGVCVEKGGLPPSYTAVFGQTMVELARQNEKIVAVTAAMPEGTGLSVFKEIYPERFFDVGIAEQHGVTFAAGLAVEGLRPVVAIYSTFLQRAFDQIIHDVCLERLPVVFALDRGGIVGEDGPTHHGLLDCSYLRCMPGMVIMAPKDEDELRHMLATAISHDGPIALRYPRGRGLGVPLSTVLKPLEIGQAQIMREGQDLLILAVGRTVNESITAADQLLEKGISATVVNCRFIKPIDQELITALAAKVPRIITVEENVLHGGFGSAVLECLADAGNSDFKLKRIAVSDRFIEHGAPDVLRRKYGLDAEGIARTAQEWLRNAF
jgi:1-deoxy-D-xylulose-5-phosphate synthase